MGALSLSTHIMQKHCSFDTPLVPQKLGPLGVVLTHNLRRLISNGIDNNGHCTPHFNTCTLIMVRFSKKAELPNNNFPSNNNCPL